MKYLVVVASFAAVLLLAAACGDAGQPATAVPTATTAADGATPETGGAATGKIAFVRNNQIYVMNADGTGQTRLTTGGGGLPAWSPVP